MAEPFKARLNPTVVARLADRLAAISPEFPRDSFFTHAVEALETLELKARCEQIARALASALPQSFEAACELLLAAIESPRPAHFGGKPWTEQETEAPDERLRGFALMPITRCVALRAGAAIEHLDLALETLRRMTGYFSSEFDIRPLLAAHPTRAWPIIMGWTTDSDPHVRRLASEGTRPRLPWAPQIPALLQDPEPGLSILDALIDDPALYTRRSVANHLNDISKDHPERALEIARVWLKSPTTNRIWVVRHALRTRLKAADPEALRLLGYSPDAPVRLTHFKVDPSVPWSGQLAFECTFENAGEQPIPVRLDYVVHFMKASGKLSPKVFQLATRRLSPAGEAAYQRRQDFRPISTRRYHPGAHRLEVRVNGRVVGGAPFLLEAPC